MQTSVKSTPFDETDQVADDLAGKGLAPLGLALLAWAVVGAGLGLCMRRQSTTPGKRDASGDAGQAAHAARFLRDLRAQEGRRLSRLDHDLRTPLGAIVSALAVVRGAPDEPAIRDDALDVIDRQAGRMHSIAQSLRALADDMTQEPAPRSSKGS